MGYYRAGFDVMGVDAKPQPRYPFAFAQADVFEYLSRIGSHVQTYAAIHASPPCQTYSTTRTLHAATYPDLIEPTRRELQRTGVPYVIENVIGAPLLMPIFICGSGLGLGVRRHRQFESTMALWSVPCAHGTQPHPIDVTGGGPSTAPRLDGAGGRSRKPRTLAEARQAMGIDWMTRAELNEAIPPAYTEFIGRQMLEGTTP